MAYRNITPSIRASYAAQGDETESLYDVKDSLAEATHQVGRADKFEKVGVKSRRIGRYLELAGLSERLSTEKNAEALKGLGLLQSMYLGGGSNWTNAVMGSDDPDLLDYYLGFSSLGSTYSGVDHG